MHGMGIDCELFQTSVILDHFLALEYFLMASVSLLLVGLLLYQQSDEMTRFS